MAPSISTTQQSYTLSGLLSSPPLRLDGRSLLAFRPLHISTGLAPQAAGSAQCLLGGTRCTVVVTAEVVDGVEAQGPYMSCDIDCPSSIPQGSNLSSLLLTLEKTLTSTLLYADIMPEQFVILRSSIPPFVPTRAWSLHLDVSFNDIQGGNLADLMFASVWAALNDVRLPKTRAIGFNTDLLKQNRQTEGNLDSFDIKGSLAKYRSTGSQGGTIPLADTSEEVAQVDNSIREKTGIDFELMDVWDSGSRIEGFSDFPIAVTVNLLPSGLLLDATLAEEACIPTSRRLLILCKPSSGKITGVHMIPSTLDVGATSAGEDTTKASSTLLGTADYKTIRDAMRSGQEYSRGLHGAIQTKIAANE